MTRRYRRLLQFICAVSLVSLLVAIIEIAQGRIAAFEPITYGLGFILFSAFIWGDVLIFSMLWLVLVPILYKLKNPYYLLLAWSGFWFVRASGEVVYSFLQQFHPAVKPYVAYLPRSIALSPQGPAAYPKYWVIEQIVFQSVAVLALIGMVYAIISIVSHSGLKHSKSGQ